MYHTLFNIIMLLHFCVQVGHNFGWWEVLVLVNNIQTKCPYYVCPSLWKVNTFLNFFLNKLLIFFIILPHNSLIFSLEETYDCYIFTINLKTNEYKILSFQFHLHLLFIKYIILRLFTLISHTPNWSYKFF